MKKFMIGLMIVITCLSATMIPRASSISDNKVLSSMVTKARDSHKSNAFVDSYFDIQF
jgi:hypothetical protein